MNTLTILTTFEIETEGSPTEIETEGSPTENETEGSPTERQSTEILHLLTGGPQRSMSVFLPFSSYSFNLIQFLISKQRQPMLLTALKAASWSLGRQE